MVRLRIGLCHEKYSFFMTNTYHKKSQKRSASRAGGGMTLNQRSRFCSMRRSGMSHITATAIYSPQAINAFKKESGIATV